MTMQNRKHKTQITRRKHIKFRQQLDDRQAKKRKKFNESFRREKCNGVVQERGGNRGGNEMR